MRRSFVFAACAAAAAALIRVTPAAAQETPVPSIASPRMPTALQIRGGDPLANAFFSPEVVMRYQRQIALTAEQRTAIVAAISTAQPRFVEAQWQLEPENAALGELLAGARVDEAAVLQQIDRVLDIERQIKRIQIEMLVRIKNQLTEEQQTQLARLGGVRGLHGLVSGDYIESPGPTRGTVPSMNWLDGSRGWRPVTLVPPGV